MINQYLTHFIRAVINTFSQSFERVREKNHLKKKTLISMPGDKRSRAWEIRYPRLFVNYDVRPKQRP